MKTLYEKKQLKNGFIFKDIENRFWVKHDSQLILVLPQEHKSFKDISDIDIRKLFKSNGDFVYPTVEQEI